MPMDYRLKRRTMRIALIKRMTDLIERMNEVILLWLMCAFREIEIRALSSYVGMRWMPRASSDVTTMNISSQLHGLLKNW